MTRLWLIQAGPLFIPTEDRESLRAIAVNRTHAQFADEIWKLRDKAFGPVLASHPDGWPYQRVDTAPVANVTQIKSKARGRA